MFFGYFIQSKLLLSLLFLNCFCGYSCFDLLELSEASRSGWNQIKVDFMNLKCLTTFSVYSLPEDPGVLRCDVFQIHPALASYEQSRSGTQMVSNFNVLLIANVKSVQVAKKHLATDIDRFA
jgi:hypothetical protein